MELPSFLAFFFRANMLFLGSFSLLVSRFLIMILLSLFFLFDFWVELSKDLLLPTPSLLRRRFLFLSPFFASAAPTFRSLL